MRIAATVLLAGCWSGSAPPTPVAPAQQPRPAFTITEQSLGPIDARSPATLDNLRRLMPGYQVRPVNDPGLEYHVYDGAEQLLYVVTSDDLSVFNVHATSGKIAVSGRSWRVGKPFQDSSVLTRCECWGDNPTCYRGGEHVAVNFARECEGLTDGDRRAFKALDGLSPQRVIWSPTAFGSSGDDDGAGDGADPGDGGDGGDGSDGD